MKVRELNALLGKLAKNNSDKDVILTIPGLTGPQWEDPAIVEASDGLYIVPKSIEDSLEAQMSREQIAAETTKYHQEALREQRDQDTGGTGGAAA